MSLYKMDIYSVKVGLWKQYKQNSVSLGTGDVENLPSLVFRKWESSEKFKVYDSPENVIPPFYQTVFL